VLEVLQIVSVCYLWTFYYQWEQSLWCKRWCWQIATGGGSEHMKEQLACFQVPSLSIPSFITLEYNMGNTVWRNGNQNNYSSWSKVVDGSWSKQAHGHSYNANSVVRVIFGTATKWFLFIGVRNKYCSVCASNNKRGTLMPDRKCFCNWSPSSCSLKDDIILEGFQQSGRMHSVQYHYWLEMVIVMFTIL